MANHGKETLLPRVGVEIAHDIEVHAPVPVHVARGQPHGIARRDDPARGAFLAKRPVPEVLPERRAAHARDDEIEASRAIEVHPRRAHRPAARSNFRVRRDVLERAVAPVAVEDAARPGLRLVAVRDGAREEEVEKTVPVEVPHRHTRTHGREISPALEVGLELEAQPRTLRHVGEADRGRRNRRRRF